MAFIARVYADLIRKEEKTIDQVPEIIREEVQQLLGGTDDNENQDID